MLPQYRFEPATGFWRHAAGFAEPPLSLGDVSYADGQMRYTAHHHRVPETQLSGYLAEASRILDSPAPAQWTPIDPVVDADFEHLRWFPLPTEIRSDA